jgi:hypothetical protein
LSRRWFCLCHCIAAAFVIALLPVLHLMLRRCRFCIRHCAPAAFIVKPPLPSSLHHRCLLCCAITDFIVALLLPS